mgnify:CR=1 FL=1
MKNPKDAQKYHKELEEKLNALEKERKEYIIAFVKWLMVQLRNQECVYLEATARFTCS